MTPELRLLATLAVALAPARAPRLLGQLGLPGRAEAIRLAEGLALAPRRARLAALAAAISAAAPAPALRPGEGRPAHALLRRLWWERRVAGRTAVRDAADPPA